MKDKNLIYYVIIFKLFHLIQTDLFFILLKVTNCEY